MSTFSVQSTFWHQICSWVFFNHVAASIQTPRHPRAKDKSEANWLLYHRQAENEVRIFLDEVHPNCGFRMQWTEQAALYFEIWARGEGWEAGGDPAPPFLKNVDPHFPPNQEHPARSRNKVVIPAAQLFGGKLNWSKMFILGDWRSCCFKFDTKNRTLDWFRYFFFFKLPALSWDWPGGVSCPHLFSIREARSPPEQRSKSPLISVLHGIPRTGVLTMNRFGWQTCLSLPPFLPSSQLAFCLRQFNAECAVHFPILYPLQRPVITSPTISSSP